MDEKILLADVKAAEVIAMTDRVFEHAAHMPLFERDRAVSGLLGFNSDQVTEIDLLELSLPRHRLKKQTSLI